MSILKDINRILLLHKKIIQNHGGTLGLISHSLLESALRRPFHGTSNGMEFYPSTEEKAAVLFHGVAKNHAFVDGNKRIAFELCLLYLLENRIEFVKPSVEETVRICEQIAESKMNVDDVCTWLKKHIRKK